MDIQEAIRAVTEHQDLSGEEMRDVMQQIMTGECTPAQIGGFLIGLRMKGETVDEVAAAAHIMRELALRVHVDDTNLVDIVGTGGDVSGTFNVSTASSFVAAAAGCRVAKHGNRSVSSHSGAADLLESAGIYLNLNPKQIEACINEVGIGFMFAPLHHSAMKYAIGPRREMAARTIFNVLGPLTNPAFAPNQLLGVFAREWVEPLAEALRQLGSKHAMVVHSEDGLDEISVCAPSFVAELKEGEIKTYTLDPKDSGIAFAAKDQITVDSPEESLAMINSVLADEPGAPRDMILLNAGAAIYVAGLAESHADGMNKAKQVLADGSAKAKLEAFARFTQQYNTEQ